MSIGLVFMFGTAFRTLSRTPRPIWLQSHFKHEVLTVEDSNTLDVYHLENLEAIPKILEIKLSIPKILEIRLSIPKILERRQFLKF